MQEADEEEELDEDESDADGDEDEEGEDCQIQPGARRRFEDQEIAVINIC